MSILLYGSTKLILMKKLEKKQDGNNANMLGAVLNISSKQHPTKQPLNLHHASHPSKTNKIYGALLKKRRRKHKWCSLMKSYSRTRQYWLTTRDSHASTMCGYCIPCRGTEKGNDRSGQIARVSQGDPYNYWLRCVVFQSLFFLYRAFFCSIMENFFTDNIPFPWLTLK